VERVVGDEPPYHTPVFVLTHFAREPEPMLGGTTFFFVTDGTETALQQARDAAGDANVLIAGGASTVQQHLRAGLVESSSCTSRPSSWGAVNGCWRTSGTPGWSRSVWSRRRRDPR